MQSRDGPQRRDAGGKQGGDAEEEYDPEEPQAVQPVRPAPEPEEYQPIEDDVEDWGGHTRHGGTTFGTAYLRADPQREQCPSAAPLGASDSLAYLRAALAKLSLRICSATVAMQYTYSSSCKRCCPWTTPAHSSRVQHHVICQDMLCMSPEASCGCVPRLR